MTWNEFWWVFIFLVEVVVIDFWLSSACGYRIFAQVEFWVLAYLLIFILGFLLIRTAETLEKQKRFWVLAENCTLKWLLADFSRFWLDFNSIRVFDSYSSTLAAAGTKVLVVIIFFFLRFKSKLSMDQKNFSCYRVPHEIWKRCYGRIPSITIDRNR